MSHACERSWEVEALREGRLSAGDAASFARHQGHCAECRALSSDYARLRALGCALPVSAIDVVGARRLREAILRAAASSDSPGLRDARAALRTPRVLAFACAASVIAAVVVSSGHGESSLPRGDSARAVVRSPPSKEASSKARIDDGEPNDLRVTTAPPPSRRPVERRRDTTPRESPNERADCQSADYEVAVDLFSARRYDEAARALHAFSMAHPERPEAEDAAFLEANALARAGRVDAAAVVAERCLDRYPASLHAPDAALLAVRAARDRHDCDRARTLATRWVPDESARRAALAMCAER